MTTKNEPKDDAGVVELQEKFDDAEDKGYFGTSPDPLPNSAYSLESGPDSPGLLEARKAFLEGEQAEQGK